eukprot:jgi/Chrzof1/7580/Cz02g29020.t1
MEAALTTAVDAAAALRNNIGFLQRSQIAIVAAFLSAIYLKLVVSRIAPGWKSLALVAPLLALNLWLPLLFHMREEVVSRTCVVFLISWLGSFKAIGMCLNRGPLAADWSVAQMIFLYVAPVLPRQDAGGPVKAGRLQDSAGTWGTLAASFVINTTILGVVSYLLVVMDMPKVVKIYIYALGLYGFVSFIMEGPAAIIVGLLRIELVPPFDKPWLATSLADFWGRRWNNSTSLLLRFLVYDPIIEGRLVKKAKQEDPQQPAPSKQVSNSMRLTAMLATFALSGLIHEAILAYVNRPYYPGPWFMFFFIQGPLLAVEMRVHKHLRATHKQLPFTAAWTLTTACLLLTAYMFFFPPIEDWTDLAPRIAQAVTSNFQAVLGPLQGLGRQYWAVAAGLVQQSAI